MKPSYFNFYLSDFPEKNHTLVYNTRTQAVAVLESDLAGKLKNKPGQIVNLDNKEFMGFMEEGFCIANDQNEQDILENWFHEISHRKNTLTATILTTYHCNFACPYCFEKDIDPAQKNMSPETADKVCNWLIQKVLENDSSEIEIYFYGGEPLVNKGLIDHIAGKMKEFCSSKNKNFKFGIITNGFLINKEDTKRWKPLGLDFYRITIDGSENWHNKTRPLKGGGPTFQSIVDNIHHNNNDVKIVISGNYTEETFPGIMELIAFIGQSDLKEKIHSLTFSKVMQNLSQSCRSKSASCSHDDDDRNVQFIRKINQALEKFDLKNSRGKIGMQTCPFKIKDTYVTITPEGDIYKCPPTLGNSDFCVGHVNKPDLNEKNDSFLAQNPWKECFPCVYLPMCGSGCYYSSFIKYGDMFKIDCPERMLEQSLMEQLKKEYEKLV